MNIVKNGGSEPIDQRKRSQTGGWAGRFEIDSAVHTLPFTVVFRPIRSFDAAVKIARYAIIKAGAAETRQS